MGEESMKYEIPQERLILSEVGEKIARACASQKAEYRWLELDLCVSRKAPPKGVELPRVASSREAAEAIRKLLNIGDLIQEVFGVLMLNARHQVVAMAVPFRGGVSSAPVDIAVMLKPVLLTTSCTAFMIFHNHPSGDPIPSADDIELTKRLKTAADLVGLRLLDHLVMTDRKYLSLADMGLMR